MSRYSVELRDKYGLPIYTLRVPGMRIYVVNSTSLIPLLERQIKTVAFAPIEAQIAAAVMGVGPAGNAIIGSNKILEHHSYLSTFVSSILPALSPGPGLDALNGAAIGHLSNSLAKCSSNSPMVVELFSWIHKELFMATTESIYGPKNPFLDPALEQAWYDFVPGILLNIPSWKIVLARKSRDARENPLIPAFEKYFAENGHHEGSLLVQFRYRHNIEHGLQGRELAATEIGQMVAALRSSVPSAFWMIYHIFSDPVVLKECREEVEKLVEVGDNDVCTVDLSRVMSSCPVLLSAWQETLRYEHIGIAPRVVMEDIMLDNQYLLKKGAAVVTVAAVQHSDPSVWGPSASDFDHRRFLREPGTKQIDPAAFRPFGGGTVLCPGRHFVSTEVMSFVALLLLRFDLKPASNSGTWIDPQKKTPITSSMPRPMDEVMVMIVSRDKREWRVNFSAFDKDVF